jgi:hypothetical protein
MINSQSDGIHHHHHHHQCGYYYNHHYRLVVGFGSTMTQKASHTTFKRESLIYNEARSSKLEGQNMVKHERDWAQNWFLVAAKMHHSDDYTVVVVAAADTVEQLSATAILSAVVQVAASWKWCTWISPPLVLPWKQRCCN